MELIDGWLHPLGREKHIYLQAHIHAKNNNLPKPELPAPSSISAYYHAASLSVGLATGRRFAPHFSMAESRESIQDDRNRSNRQLVLDEIFKIAKNSDEVYLRLIEEEAKAISEVFEK